MFKKIILVCALLLVSVLNCFAEQKNYKEIYESLEPANFEYIFGIDPYQAEDYTRYTFSPYPLLRIGREFGFKNMVIPPGYYLLTPRTKDGKTYVLFKENGRVKYLIPVYEMDLVNPLFYEQYIPTVKKTGLQKVTSSASDFINTHFAKQTQKMPAPKSYAEVNDIQGEFWQVILYYGEKKYYMLFLQR